MLLWRKLGHQEAESWWESGTGGQNWTLNSQPAPPTSSPAHALVGCDCRDNQSWGNTYICIQYEWSCLHIIHSKYYKICCIIIILFLSIFSPILLYHHYFLTNHHSVLLFCLLRPSLLHILSASSPLPCQTSINFPWFSHHTVPKLLYTTQEQDSRDTEAYLDDTLATLLDRVLLLLSSAGAWDEVRRTAGWWLYGWNSIAYQRRHQAWLNKHHNI